MSDINTATFFLLNALAGQSMFLDWLIVFFAVYLTYILMAVLILGIVLWHSPRSEKIKTAAIALISVAVSRGIFVEAIRFFYHHPRPFVALSGVRQLFPETGYSFPSGHTAFFFALSAVVYHYHKKAGVTFFVLSAIMGLARIAAGVHYPFDIIGGALIGWLVGFGICALAKRFSVKDVQ